MPRPRAPRSGRKLRNQPKGAPLFYAGQRLPRVVTSDPWAFLRYESRVLLSKEHAASATAYIDQAFDFFEAAAIPRTSSRPLLYYYSFLNLAKVLILHKRQIELPLIIKHGIKDPKANVKQRLLFPGQQVQFMRANPGHAELFPELLLGFEGSTALCNRVFRVIDLMKQIPSIHRTSCSVLDHKPHFCPVKEIEFYSNGREVWAVLRLKRHDRDVRETFSRLRKTRRFSRIFSQAAADDNNELRFETEPVQGTRRGIDRAIGTLSKRLRALGVYGVLTQLGYRYYLAEFQPRNLIPQLCSVYAVMFYLGSITRYKPHDFDSIISRGYEWLVAEFLETQPSQFLYLVASHIAGVEVVKPYSIIGHG